MLATSAKGKHAEACLIYSDDNKNVAIQVADRDFVTVPYDQLAKLSALPELLPQEGSRVSAARPYDLQRKWGATEYSGIAKEASTLTNIDQAFAITPNTLLNSGNNHSPGCQAASWLPG